MSRESMFHELENAYWNAEKEGDLDKYKSFLHPEIVAWPPSGREVIHYDQLVHEVGTSIQQYQMLYFKLDFLAVADRGEAVDVFYNYCCFYIPKVEGVTAFSLWGRAFHCWVLATDRWQIITGMGTGSPATLSPSGESRQGS